MNISSLFNAAALENVLQTLQERLEAQNATIQRLEAELANRPTKQNFLALQKRVDTALENIEKRFIHLEERVSELQEPVAQIAHVSRRLTAAEERLAGKAELKDVADAKETLAGMLHANVQQLQKDKAAGSVVAALESSQHRLFEEVVAVQKLVACKVDRVELPLLDAASEKMKALLDFREKASARVQRLESEVEAAKRALAQKESKEVMVQRMQAIHERLQAKADVAWVQEHLSQPLAKAQEGIAKSHASEEILHKLITDQNQLAAKISNLYQRSNDLSQLEGKVRQLYEHLSTKVDISRLDQTSRLQKQATEKLIKDTAEHAAHEARVQAAYLEDLRQQLAELRQQHSATDKRVTVALKFVDWYTDVKLKS